MYRIKVEVEGIAPILYNRFTEEAKAGLESRKTGGKATKEERITEAGDKVYKNGRGLYLPGEWFKKAMLTGCQLANLKYGRRGFYAYLSGGVFVEEREIILGKDAPDYIDERMGRIPPKTGAAAIIRRPAIKEGWRATFTLLVADDGLPESHIKTALETAGLYTGVGSYRPEFGRFIVKDWKVDKSAVRTSGA